MSLILKTISQYTDDFLRICTKTKHFVTNNSLNTKPLYNFAQEALGDVVVIARKKTHSTKSLNLPKEVLEKYLAEGKGSDEIAEIFGCARTTVNVYLRKFGMSLKQTVTISDDVLRTQVAEGMSLPQMAKANNCSQSTIRDRMKALGLRTLEAERAANIPKEDLERLVSAGYSCSRIAKKYKVTELQIGRLLKELGLETETEKILKMITRQDILDLYEAGASYAMLPEIFGIPESFIYNLLKDFDLTGLSHKATKFTGDLVDINFEILSKMVKAGKTKAQIAEELGISLPKISKYLDDYGILPIKRHAKTVLPDNFSLSQMIKKGATLEEISEDYDISLEALKKHMKKEGVLGYVPKNTSS